MENPHNLRPTPSTWELYFKNVSNDQWLAAKALLESARRYAVAARRAIEARYVVNLSELEADEPFVAGPRLWADEVYDYDLSLPKAVGLVLGEGQPNGVFTSPASFTLSRSARLLRPSTYCVVVETS